MATAWWIALIRPATRATCACPSCQAVSPAREVYDGPGPPPPCDPLYTTDYLTRVRDATMPSLRTACTCGLSRKRHMRKPWHSERDRALPETLHACGTGVCTAVTVTTAWSSPRWPVKPAVVSVRDSWRDRHPDITGNTGHLCQANATGGKAAPAAMSVGPNRSRPSLPKPALRHRRPELPEHRLHSPSETTTRPKM